MFLVLTAAAGVSDAAISAAHNALSAQVVAEAPRRLSPCAAEIRFRGALQTPLSVAGDLDVNIVPAVNRQKKLLIADMDSTMISVECIDELADFAGLKAQVSEITERAMRGEISFSESLKSRVALLRGLSGDVLQQCYEERIHLNPGAETLVKTMKARGAFTALVSGGFTYFTERVAKIAGFDLNRANSLVMEDGALTGAVGMPILGRRAKLESLNAFCAAQSITLADTIAVGDGANDLAMIEAAGLGVAYRAKPALKEKADVVLDHSDLTALLSIQGICAADYVS